MALQKNNTINNEYTNNADGGEFKGGVVQRLLKWLGADITLTGSGTNTYTFPAATDTLVGRASTDTLTNKRIQPRSSTAASGNVTPDLTTANIWQRTALSAALTINAPTGTPVLGAVIVIMLKDNATPRAITWNSIYKGLGASLPSTTTASKTMVITSQYDGTDWLTLTVTQV